MAKVFDCITDDIQRFISEQHLFFVATAPLSSDGHVNLSPKGLNCLHICSPHQVMYLDLTGSGNETSAHLQENERITLMFCAFQGAPKIVRLYGKGKTILPTSPDWEALAAQLPALPGARQIILADIQRVQLSCGFGVPLYSYLGQRDELTSWAHKKGEEGLKEYRQIKNQVSIDGLPTPLRSVSAIPQ